MPSTRNSSHSRAGASSSWSSTPVRVFGITSERTASPFGSHAPPAYRCPFCAYVGGGETERNKRSDLVWHDDATTAFLAPKWWDTNPAHVLVVPNEHFENLYEISHEALAAVYAAAQRVAVALRDEYGCDGTSTRQHNEPGGGQDVWHFHVHVFPRYDGDALYANHERTRWATPEERAPYARRLRERLRPPD